MSSSIFYVKILYESERVKQMYNFDKMVYGGDYNPDQWIKTPEIWDEDIRLMKKAHINCATVGIFAWSLYEPREGQYNFEWLDTIIDKLYSNGISVILSTPSGARPAWMAQKYPEVLRTPESGIRNEYGVRHNHCLTSPIYRRKVREINKILAIRYKNHPAIKMWHVSNEYSGQCHCELCRQAFIDWLKDYYHNDIRELNNSWWNGFWSHWLTDWQQISTPKDRGENHVSALKLCWDKFVTDSHISFFENEVAPLKEITPNIPVTTNLMKIYTGINYQKLAKHLDLISLDDYPFWEVEDNMKTAVGNSFAHDTFRSLKGGQPYFLMESTPSIVNWWDINKIPKPRRIELSSVQAISHGADSVQYFQWRKSRGGHEKYHGAVVDHCGHENTRVFNEVTKLGDVLTKLDSVVGTRCNAKVAIIFDWENDRAIKYFHGYNNLHRDYLDECIKWYKPFWNNSISADVISMEDDFSKYDIVVAPFLYMLKDGTIERIENYVKNGGNFLGTYLTGLVDKNDLCHLGGFPAGKLKDVFGVWCEETDSLPENIKGYATFDNKTYEINHICDIIHSTGAEVLGKYMTDFYKGMPSVTKNKFGDGTAYYVAFRNDSNLADDVIGSIINDLNIKPDSKIITDCFVKRRGNLTFIMNFSDTEQNVILDKEYTNILTGKNLNGRVKIPECDYLILSE